MPRKLLAAIVRALIAFFWSFITWGLTPIHEGWIMRFKDEAAVGQVLQANALESGIYGYPLAKPSPGMTAEQKKALIASADQEAKEGPIVFAAVRVGGFPSFGRALVFQFLGQFFAACLLLLLLSKTSGLSYIQKVMFLGIVGLASGVIVDLPNWNWWGFSTGYVFADILDSGVTWVLAGLAMVKLARD
jgi:hypothetical protein